MAAAHHFAGIRIALQQPQAQLPAGQPAQFGDRLHAQQRMPAGTGEALVGRQRPAEHPGQHLEHPPQLHAVLGLGRRGRLRRVLEQRQQRLAVGVGQRLGALGGETSGGVLEAHLKALAGHLEVHRQRHVDVHHHLVEDAAVPYSRRRRGVVLVEVDEVEQAVQAQLAVAPANRRQRMAPMFQARALVVECATGAVEQIDGSRQPARQGVQEQAEQAVRSRLLGAPVADEAGDYFIGIAEAAQRSAMRRQQQRTQGQAAAFGQGAQARQAVGRHVHADRRHAPGSLLRQAGQRPVAGAGQVIEPEQRRGGVGLGLTLQRHVVAEAYRGRFRFPRDDTGEKVGVDRQQLVPQALQAPAVQHAMVFGDAQGEAPLVQRQRGEAHQWWAAPVERGGLLFLDPGTQAQAPCFPIEATQVVHRHLGGDRRGRVDPLQGRLAAVQVEAGTQDRVAADQDRPGARQQLAVQASMHLVQDDVVQQPWIAAGLALQEHALLQAGHRIGVVEPLRQALAFRRRQQGERLQRPRRRARGRIRRTRRSGQQARQFADALVVEHVAQGKGKPRLARHDLHLDQADGVAADLEEIVADADRRAFQHALPDLQQGRLGGIGRRFQGLRGRLGGQRRQQRATVELAFGGQRQAFDPGDPARQHVGRQARLEEATQGLLAQLAAEGRGGARRERAPVDALSQRLGIARAHRVAVVTVGTLQQRVLTDAHLEAMAAQQVAQGIGAAGGGTVALVMDLQDDLPDLGQRRIVETEQHIHFRALHVDLQQVDTLQAQFVDHLVEAAQAAAVGFGAQAVVEDFVDVVQQQVGPALLALVAQVASDDVAFAAGVGVLGDPGEGRVARIVGEGFLTLGVGQTDAEYLDLRCVASEVGLQAPADRCQRLEGDHSRARRAAGDVQREQADVGTDVEDHRVRRQDDAVAAVDLVDEDFLVDVLGFVEVQSGDPVPAGQVDFQPGLVRGLPGGGDEGDDPAIRARLGRIGLVGEYRRLAHCRVFQQRAADLAQFDAVAVDLHLFVDPPEELQATVGAPAHQVAAAVQAAAARPALLEEAPGRLAGVAGIAARHPGAADP
ncbi:hypothetical protein PA92_04177 [Pseudomonas aeruginosa]|nr:hypothetical protein PA92_04177 [Pseudomonas aeruginosa]